MDCPLCQRGALVAFHDGGSVPLFVNVLHDDQKAARAVERGALQLGVCTGCGFVHNVAFEPRRLDYAPGYENSLHGSPTFDSWARAQATELVARHHLQGAAAVDVGGGRGEFMERLIDAGTARGLVVDPSAPDDALWNSRGPITIERRRFDAQDVSTDVGLVLSRHVFEHLHDPVPLAAAIVGAARRVGAGVYIEVPNGLFTLRDMGVWDLIYEHCSYFTPSALSQLLGRAGAADATLSEAFSGQFLAAEWRPGTERSIGFNTSGAQAAPVTPADVARLCDAFAREHRELVRTWSMALQGRSSRGVALWGAGSKGATFLNSVPGARAVVCAVDVNPLKHGKFVAGTGHPIVAPQDLRGLGVDTLIVLNPAYAGEIEAMVQSLGLAAEILTVEVAREAST
ncbi:MAG: methyltransferase domain-containing protein [Planctomycetota bacterium]